MTASSMILVFVGGGFGAALRFSVHELFKHLGWIERFPWHTLAVNVLGSFVLGVLAALCKDRPLFLLLGTGLCGGFTTFSTFSYETLILIESGRWATAATYGFTSFAAALAGVLAGYWMFRPCGDSPALSQDGSKAELVFAAVGMSQCHFKTISKGTDRVFSS